MAIIAKIRHKNGQMNEQKISGYFEYENILELEEIVGMKENKLGEAAGMDTFHCLYQASDCGRDLKLLSKVKYFRHITSKNKDYPVTVEFF